MIYVALQGFFGGVHIVILDAVLLTRLLHDRGDPGVVGLDDTREEVVCCLVV